MTWAPRQKHKNSKMDAQEIHGKDQQMSMTSLKVKTK